MMKRKALTNAALVAVVATIGLLLSLQDVSAERNADVIVYVTSQGLYYDSIVTAETLPPHGKFQQLHPPVEVDGYLSTEWGPGDKDFCGGRWWIDANGNGEMDMDDVYFSCPLLGPGRIEP